MKKGLLAVALFSALFLGFLPGCDKPVINMGGDLDLESVAMPESLELTVGDRGSFLIEVHPAGAEEYVNISVSSSDPAVLSVSADGLSVSYEALSAGECRVTARVGDKSASVSVTVRAAAGPVPGPGDDPSGPVSKSGCVFGFNNGVRTVDGVITAASVTVKIENGAEAGNYVISCRVDGGEPLVVRGVFVGQSRDVSLDSDLAFGRHTVAVDVTEEKGLSESVHADGVVWVKGPSVETLSVRFTSDYLADFTLSSSGAVSLADGEEGVMEITYAPASTVVEYDLEVPSFLSVDRTGNQPGRGSWKLPFKVTGKGSGTLAVRLMNGDETAELSGAVDGNSTRTLGVRDFTAPEALSLVLSAGKQDYTFKVVPESAHDKAVKSVSSSNEGIVKVGAEGLKMTLVPVAGGSADVTVEIGVARKVIRVTVIDDVSGQVVPVTGFQMPSAINLLHGESLEYDFQPEPAGATDAGNFSVESSNPAVLSVERTGFHVVFHGAAPGESSVTVRMGQVSRSVNALVTPIVVTSFSITPAVKSVMTRTDKFTYTISYDPSNADDADMSVSCSDDSVLRCTLSGTVLTLEALKVGRVTVEVKVGSKTSAFEVTVNPIAVSAIHVSPAFPSTMVRGASATSTVSYEPANADDAVIQVSSGSPSIIRVTQDGNRATLSAEGIGTAVITVKVGGKTEQFNVTVTGKSLVDFSIPSIVSQMTKGDSGSYAIVKDPSDADDAAPVTASSSDESVLKAGIDGMNLILSARKKGSVTVTVKVGSKSHTYNVQVLGKALTDFSVPDGMNIPVGTTQYYTFSPVPADADDVVLNAFRSSNPDIVVEHNGGLEIRLTANYTGSSTVTVNVSGVEKSFMVYGTGTVVTGIDVSAVDGQTLRHGVPSTFTISPVPANAWDANTMQVSARNPAVCSVSKTGDYTFSFNPVGYGTASFGVTCGRQSASFSVNVPESISLSYGTVQVPWLDSIDLKVEGDFAGWDFSTTGTAFANSSANADDSSLKVTVEGNVIHVYNRTHSRSTTYGTLTVRTTATGVTQSVDLYAVAAPNENRFTVSAGLDSQDRVYVDVTVRAGKEAVTLNNLRGYIWSSDSEAENPGVLNEAKNALNGGSPSVLTGSGGAVKARLFSLIISKTVNLWGYYHERIYLSPSSSFPDRGDSYGSYSDGFGIHGYLYVSGGAKYEIKL